MAKTIKVVALAAFTYAGTLHHPGEVEVPEGAVEGLEKKQLVRRLDGDASASLNTSSSGDAEAKIAQLRAENEQLKTQLEGAGVLTFAAVLREEFSEAEAATVLGSEYSTPQTVIEADPKLLNKLQGFGDAKVAKLKELAVRFVG